MLLPPWVALSFENEAGKALSLSPFSAFWCEKCEEALPNNLHSIKQAGTHGRYFTGMSMDERMFVLSGHVDPKMTLKSAICSIQEVFNPTLSGVLTYRNARDNTLREIGCRLSELPKLYWSGNRLRFDVQLTATDPFWKGPPQLVNIAETMKQFHFPVVIPREGLSFGLMHHRLETRFENAGNVESGFVAVLLARYGRVKNPEIRNEVTGERIRILFEMNKGDELVITNLLQKKHIDINGRNGFRHLDAGNTTFFTLAVGTNRIGYHADENISNLFVHLRYVPNYTFV
jgi:hypothetical protein